MVCKYNQQFSGNEQHDCQEFLNTLLDGLHEDLNRILKKPPNVMNPEREAELEVLPQQIASQQEWNVYRMRDDSIVVDFFQGQFRNRMECLTCRKTSTTYNSFMYLSLPLPQTRHRVSLQQCLDMFVQEEVMEKADAWYVSFDLTLILPHLLKSNIKCFSGTVQIASNFARRRNDCQFRGYRRSYLSN